MKFFTSPCEAARNTNFSWLSISYPSIFSELRVCWRWRRVVRVCVFEEKSTRTAARRQQQPLHSEHNGAEFTENPAALWRLPTVSVFVPEDCNQHDSIANAFLWFSPRLSRRRRRLSVSRSVRRKREVGVNFESCSLFCSAAAPHAFCIGWLLKNGGPQ